MKKSKKQLSLGAIVGIVFAIVCIISISAVLGWYFLKPKGELIDSIDYEDTILKKDSTYEFSPLTDRKWYDINKNIIDCGDDECEKPLCGLKNCNVEYNRNPDCYEIDSDGKRTLVYNTYCKKYYNDNGIKYKNKLNYKCAGCPVLRYGDIVWLYVGPDVYNNKLEYDKNSSVTNCRQTVRFPFMNYKEKVFLENMGVAGRCNKDSKHMAYQVIGDKNEIDGSIVYTNSVIKLKLYGVTGLSWPEMVGKYMGVELNDLNNTGYNLTYYNTVDVKDRKTIRYKILSDRENSPVYLNEGYNIEVIPGNNAIYKNKFKIIYVKDRKESPFFVGSGNFERENVAKVHFFTLNENEKNILYK